MRELWSTLRMYESNADEGENYIDRKVVGLRAKRKRNKGQNNYSDMYRDRKENKMVIRGARMTT